MIRTINLVLLIFATFLPAKAQHKTFTKTLNYQLSWNGNSAFLNIDLFYYAKRGNITKFHYGQPQIGNQKGIFKVLRNISTGKNDILNIDTLNREITIKHKLSGLKKLHYEVDGNLISPAHHNNANEQFRPQLANGCFYSLGFNIFLDADLKLFKKLTYRWKVYPRNTKYFSSADPTSKPAKKVTINAEGMQDIYIAMEPKLIVKTYQVKGKPYYAVTSGRDSLNNIQKNISPFFEVFFPAISDFWKDSDKNFYFLSLIPFLNDVPDNLTGYGLTEGFSMRYKGPYDLKKMEVIAHETSHRWIGNKLTIEAKGMEYSWFDEGFNDYIDTYILAQTKMLSQADFLDYINKERLLPYYRNPARNASADSIEKHFWTDHNYEYLPYQRGFIYAFYLDNQIRLNSGGKYTIRDFLLKLLDKRKSKYANLTIDDFIEAAAEFLPKYKVADEIRRYMQGGESIDFHHAKFIDAYHVEFKDEVPMIVMDKDADLIKLLSWN